MIQSLFIKLGILALTTGLVFWIGWQSPQGSVKEAALADVTEVSSPSAAVPGETAIKAVEHAGSKAVARNHAVSVKIASSDKPYGRLVDLNRASAEDLESLPGIGAVLARRVIDYRKSVGRFQTVEDLRDVKGIGAKKFDRVKPLVTVAPADSTKRAGKSPL